MCLIHGGLVCQKAGQSLCRATTRGLSCPLRITSYNVCYTKLLRARNYGILNSRGTYIAFLDSDDLWKPYKLKTQLDFMKQYGYGFTYSYYDIINGYGTKIKENRATPLKINYKRLLNNNPIGCLTVLIKADVRITSYNVCYTKLLRSRERVCLKVQYTTTQYAHYKAYEKEGGRITSYNVCYTKLLRYFKNIPLHFAYMNIHFKN